jgi:hypothetical protein
MQGGSCGNSWRVLTATRKRNPQEETPSQKEKEDIASAALGRKGTVIHR